MSSPCLLYGVFPIHPHWPSLNQAPMNLARFSSPSIWRGRYCGSSPRSSLTELVLKSLKNFTIGNPLGIQSAGRTQKTKYQKRGSWWMPELTGQFTRRMSWQEFSSCTVFPRNGLLMISSRYLHMLHSYSGIQFVPQRTEMHCV